MVSSRGRRWGVRELIQIYFKRKRTKGQNSIYCMLHLWKNIIGYFFTFPLSDELYELSNFILKFQPKVYQSEVKSLSSGLLFVTPWTARLLRPWDFPGKNTGVGGHFLFREIFLTQGLNLGLPHFRQALYHLSHQGSLKCLKLMD